MEFLFDFLAEFFGELFIGLPLETFFHSKRIQSWVKVLFCVLFWTAIEAFLAWAAWGCICDGETWPITLLALGGNALWIWVGIKAWPEIKKM